MAEPNGQDTRAYTPLEQPQPETVQQPREDWREPSYTQPAAGERGYSPTRHGNGYGAAYARQQTKSQPEKRGLSAGTVAWIVILCLLLGAGVGGAAGWYTASRALEGLQTTQVHLGSDDPAPTPGTTPTAEGTLAPWEIYDAALSQVVGIRTEVTKNSFGQVTSTAVCGTGFVISSDGYILTNHHVIEYAVIYDQNITVMFYDGTEYPATLVGFEDDNDIAVIKIEATDLTPVTFCSSMTVGEIVRVVGNPLGELTYTMTTGYVSALDRVIATDDFTSIHMFQIDAAVNSGNSGGPVYNGNGQVIGIVTAKYGATGMEGLGFAIPIEEAVSIATQLIENGYVAGKAWLGVSVEDVSQSVAAYFNMPVGIYVYSVTADSAAAAAGIRPGDIITALDGTEVASVAELKTTLRSYRAGDTVYITIYRSGEALELEVVLDEELPEA